MTLEGESDYLHVGREAVRRGLLTREDLEEAIRELGRRAYQEMRADPEGRIPDLGEFLVEKGRLREEDLRAITAELNRPVAEPSSRKFGKYTLLREIGRGGMSVVWEAFDNDLRRRVAVKFLTTHRGGGLPLARDEQDETLRRFYREAQTAAVLSHPNIIRIFEVDVRDGLHYIAMQYIEGVALDDVLEKEMFERDERIRMLRDAARGVEHAHARGILHRDLKPGNIMIDEERHVYVMDFGLARNVREEEQLTLSGVAIGTPSYMSPEHAQGSKGQVDPRSDVYSLGAVLFHILTGRAPFTGANPMEVMLAVVQEDPPRPSSLRRGAPPDLDAVCLRALEKLPEDRYPTAGAFADDLDRYLAGGRVVARPGSSGRHRRGARRGARNLFFVGVASLLALLAGMLLVYQGRAIEKAGGPDFEEGVRHFERGRNEEALRSLTRAGAERRDYPYLWYYRALTLERLGRTNEAREDMERAVRLLPENPIFRSELDRLRGR